MENTAQPNELLQGSIIPNVIKLATPVLIGQLILLFYGILDTIFISGIDSNSTAYMTGVGVIFPVYMLYMALGIGLFTGLSALVARGLGERNSFIIENTAITGLALALVVSVLLGIILYLFSGSIVALLTGTQVSTEATGYAHTYLLYIIPGLCFTLLTQSLLGVLMGQGVVKYYAMSMILSTLLNIALDPLFIYTFNMGVAGAGLATSISLAVGTLVAYGAFKKEELAVSLQPGRLVLKGDIVKEIVRIGLPQVAGLLILNFGAMGMNFIIGSISEVSINSWVLALRMDEFILLIGYAFATAMLTMVGQNFGAGNLERVKEIVRKVTGVTLLLGVVVIIIYNLIAAPLFGLFTSLQEVVDNSLLQVRYLSFTYLAILVSVVLNSAFQATGRALPGLIFEVVRMLVLVIPLSAYAVFALGYGNRAVFMIFGAANIIVMFIAVIWAYRYFNNLEVARYAATQSKSEEEPLVAASPG